MGTAPPPPRGIIAAGNFVVDHIKLVDRYPEQDQLALVRSSSPSNGGGPYNLLKNLSAMQVDFPLQAVGLLGEDADGDWIVEDCRQAGIGTRGLQTTSSIGTSWTDVMSVASSGRRTFFHYPGANAALNESHFDFSKSGAKFFYLGYLNLLDELDALNPAGQTAAARVFNSARSQGMVTVADTVSGNHAQFGNVIASAAQYLDILLLNELEAGWIVGRTLDMEQGVGTLEAAGREILDLGVARAVVIHFEQGAIALQPNGNLAVQGCVALPADRIAGTNGAGDGFAAGLLYGLHEDFDMEQSLRLAVSTAAMCLTDPTPSAGLKPIGVCRNLADQYGYRSF